MKVRLFPGSRSAPTSVRRNTVTARHGRFERLEHRETLSADLPAAIGAELPEPPPVVDAPPTDSMITAVAVATTSGIGDPLDPLMHAQPIGDSLFRGAGQDGSVTSTVTTPATPDPAPDPIPLRAGGFVRIFVDGERIRTVGSLPGLAGVGSVSITIESGGRLLGEFYVDESGRLAGQGTSSSELIPETTVGVQIAGGGHATHSEGTVIREIESP